LFPGLAHVSALQKEGLPIWDAFGWERVIAYIFILLVLADAIAMAQVSGSVGPTAVKGAGSYVDLSGETKSGVPTTTQHSCDPPALKTIERLHIRTLTSTPFQPRILMNGIGKPSIFTGIPRILPLPACFPGDLMHQPLINLAALLLDPSAYRPDGPWNV
jgi:hypothetical protein